MLPPEWTTRLVDLDVEPLPDSAIRWADVVFLSGMIVHQESAHEIAHRCRALDRRLVAGGPLFTTNHQQFPEIDHFVLGEAEDVVEELVGDLRSGAPRRFYRAEGFPDIARTPIPRWELADLRRYAMMPVQFSRGCPHDCEFCDVIELNGRIPRTKSPDQVIAELDALQEQGWGGDVFIVDDNFIGKRSRARALLEALIEWRARTTVRMRFLTEATITLAEDPVLLSLMVRAGFYKVFLGIETPELESLRECHKIQNTRSDLVESIRRIQAAGLEVMGGFIVGFDHDGPDIFERQFTFIQRAGVVTAMVGILTALPRTRLYQRLKKEGRLLAESAGNNTQARCNFVPVLGRERLERGYRELMQRLYEPRAYYRRARTLLRQCRPRTRSRVNLTDLRALARSMWILGFQERGRRDYWRFLTTVLIHHRQQFGVAVELTIHGHHFRKLAASL
jgi:radical SAM superfamily enzyme YgiQ (UPF0313 family)